MTFFQEGRTLDPDEADDDDRQPLPETAEKPTSYQTLSFGKSSLPDGVEGDDDEVELIENDFPVFPANPLNPDEAVVNHNDEPLHPHPPKNMLETSAFVVEHDQAQNEVDDASKTFHQSDGLGPSISYQIQSFGEDPSQPLLEQGHNAIKHSSPWLTRPTDIF